MLRNTYYIFVIFALLLSTSGYARQGVSSNRYELLSGVRRSRDEKTFWDRKYNKASFVFGKAPAKFLADNSHYLSPGSNVLDIGMGEGRNAVFLARKGHQVTGVDISSVAVKKARYLAKEFGVRINAVVSSIEDYNVAKSSFDAIICFYYVNRKLHKKMLSWLRPNGVLIYEAYTDLQKKVPGYENYDNRYLLRPGELLQMFKGFTVRKYEEPTHLKSFTASIIIEKTIKK